MTTPIDLEAVAKHEADILDRAKRIVLAIYPYAKAEQYKDGRWTICVHPSRLTFLQWSASEREVWCDFAIWLSSTSHPNLELLQRGRDINKPLFVAFDLLGNPYAVAPRKEDIACPPERVVLYLAAKGQP